MTQTLTRPEAAQGPRTSRPKAWNVVLLDDDHHSYEYVIRMVQSLFGRTAQEALEAARKVDSDGRVVLLTTHREHAELKREQVHGFGADPLIASCVGAMSAVLEPADLDGDGDGGGDGRAG